MENDQKNEIFQYTYSAREQQEVQRIRSKYIPKEESKMDQLRRLDAGVGKKATSSSIAVGVIGALIMGFGMSLAMTDLGISIGLGGAAMAAGIIVGIVGMALVSAAYPVYCRVLKREREKIAPEILRLTDELMK